MPFEMMYSHVPAVHNKYNKNDRLSIEQMFEITKRTIGYPL